MMRWLHDLSWACGLVGVTQMFFGAVFAHALRSKKVRIQEVSLTLSSEKAISYFDGWFTLGLFTAVFGVLMHIVTWSVLWIGGENVTARSSNADPPGARLASLEIQPALRALR